MSKVEPMKFVIPSYKRCEKLKKKTLTYLDKQGVDNQDVYIFTRVDDEQLSDYIKKIYRYGLRS